VKRIVWLFVGALMSCSSNGSKPPVTNDLGSNGLPGDMAMVAMTSDMAQPATGDTVPDPGTAGPSPVLWLDPHEPDDVPSAPTEARRSERNLRGGQGFDL
jgi:hypothetical protein